MKINRRNFINAVGAGTAAISLDALGAEKFLPHQEPETARAAARQASSGVLILLAHPNIGQSKANRALAEAVKDLPGVKYIELYTAPFTADTYKKAFAEASTIVFQFPFYWASAPSMLKKWCDEIFMTLSEERKGKKLMVATTTGSEYDAYRSGGRNQYTIDELLRPLQLLANHSGMVWQTPFAVYGASLPNADESIREGAASYKQRIRELLQ